jgi:magnesium-transporting ATPase (P-type)
VVTLAVGDGGNDCVMIKQANVGVGITGEEGTAASRAADYAIGQFRFLHGLLFVHGWWNYRRISKLILYIFYKTTLVALSMFYFGFFSAFSGQQFFNDVAYQLYNVAFTAGPVMILAIFDQGLDRETLEDFPKSYGAVVGAKMFNPKLFALWIGR